jgi:hypothetical protein
MIGYFIFNTSYLNMNNKNKLNKNNKHIINKLPDIDNKFKLLLKRNQNDTLPWDSLENNKYVNDATICQNVYDLEPVITIY